MYIYGINLNNFNVKCTFIFLLFVEKKLLLNSLKGIFFFIKN